MKLHLFILIIVLPLFVTAQNFNPPKYRPPLQDQMFLMMYDRPKPQKVEIVKPYSRNSVENAEAKLAKEERKLKKLGNKVWDIEADLKTKNKNLQLLENAPENSNDSNRQKNIEKCKKQIAESQDKLNNAKIELELSSKRAEELEKAVEDAKFIRTEY
jgi:hypothetical protein